MRVGVFFKLARPVQTVPGECELWRSEVANAASKIEGGVGGGHVSLRQHRRGRRGWGGSGSFFLLRECPDSWGRCLVLGMIFTDGNGLGLGQVEQLPVRQ
jgi:hypothetical protein